MNSDEIGILYFRIVYGNAYYKYKIRNNYIVFYDIHTSQLDHIKNISSEYNLFLKQLKYGPSNWIMKGNSIEEILYMELKGLFDKQPLVF